MKRSTKAKMNSAIAAVLITIPIVICKIRIDQKPEAGVRTPTEKEIEIQIAQNTAETETVEIQTVKETEPQTEPETESPTMPKFNGYDFIPLSAELQVNIFTLCKQYDIAYDLILAVIKTESNFHTDAIGDNGKAIGLMQIQPQWWQGLADAAGLNINDPLGNVNLGIIILTDALNANMGNLEKALKQYNTGDPNWTGNEYINDVYANYQWILDVKAGE